MLYIMRHGKTDWNERKKLQGQTDIPLNDEGRMMASAAGKEYADIHLDVCYCSTLVRARETAELFFKERKEIIPIIYDDRLKEMGFGKYEGVEKSFERENCPVNVFFEHPEEYNIPVEEGESLDSLFERTGEFLREKVFPELKEGKDILIIGHGAMNSSIICQIKYGSDRRRLWDEGIPNCKIIKLL